MARGLWWAAAPPVCIKPLQPGCRPGKTGKPPCGRGKPYNRAFGAREIHPYPRLRRYFPRRGKSALHFALISYVVKSITVISHLRWLPPLSGFAGLPPRESMSLDFRVALLPYKSSSFATLFRGQNKPLYASPQRHVAQCLASIVPLCTSCIGCASRAK